MFGEVAGVVAGATEAAADGAGLAAAGDVFAAGGTAPTAASDGLTEGAGSVVAGVIFVTVPGGPTADEGPGLAVAEAAGIGVVPSINSRLRLLGRLALRA